jgi:hypothetical protein
VEKTVPNDHDEPRLETVIDCWLAD